MKLVAKILLLCLLFGSSLSCIKKEVSDLKEIKIAYWGATEEIEAIKKIAKKIEDEVPGVKLVLEHIAIGGDPTKFSQKILTEAAGGTPPDIAFCEVNLFVDFYSKGLFIPLNDYKEKDKDFSIENYFPAIVDRFTVNNELYIIPRDVAPFAVVYYNKDLFDKEGLAYPDDNWDVNKLLEYAKKLTVRDAQGAVKQYGFYTWSWPNFMYVFGGGYVDDVKNPTKFTLNSPGSIAGLQFYLDMMYKHKVMPTPSALDTGYQELFKTGKLAMYCSGIWETPQLRTGVTFDWDVVMFPKGPNGKRKLASGGSGYGILKWCKHKDLAWEVLKRLASADAQVDLAKIGLAQPADRKLAATDVWAKSKEKPLNKKMLNEAAELIIFDPFTPKWNYINRNIIMMKMDLVFLNKKKLKPTVEDIAKEVNKVLKEK
ncbi:MAG: sugar ABC transporter substrate-binding protein [Spirochaetes bacterium]|nr:sugar ABC transporter substrate-binding protein [Spirochaetota bacterium]